MPSSPRRRLNKDVIIETALDISLASDESVGVFPTGQALGAALGVDRSAIWRHFADKDDLLLELADAMLAPVAGSVPAEADPETDLELIWTGSWEAFERRPQLGAQLGHRFLRGHHVAVLVERTLGAFLALGFDERHAALYERSFVDLMLAAHATHARYLLASAAERDAEIRRDEAALRTLPPTDFPVIARHIGEIVSVDPVESGRLALDLLLSGIRTHRPAER